ncbi:MAG: ABC transporter ATP-binding protein [Eubacteriales bacterium]|nr:ABC transporter ATP-binding protein [Eubacteriales bacterium]
MESITLNGIEYAYDSAPVLQDICLTIRKGEFFTLLGSSGCGKTTLLRLMAGFLKPDKGTIAIDGRDITPLPPEKRSMGVVFQNYALFPNMTVEENIAYGLRIRHRPAAEIKKQCAYFLELTDMGAYRDRRIEQLSGGQQQRVAIARALIVAPDMLLLDEPLSNLDAALRVRMRQELRDIQEKTGVTTLFITHDQQEALSISHRIAVMDKGHIRQIGTPAEVYDRPANQFVANFVGVCNALSPEAAAALGAGERLMCRPEQLVLSREEGGLPVTVVQVRFDGPCYSYTVRHGESLYRVTMFNRPGAFFPAGSSAYMSLYRG